MEDVKQTDDVINISAGAYWTLFFKLTVKQRKFVETYLTNGRDAVTAYRSVYNVKKPARYHADEANRILKNPDIADIIKSANAMDAEILRSRYQISAETVLGTLSRLMSYDIRDIAEWGEDGVLRVKPSEQIDGEALMAITEIGSTTSRSGTKVMVKLADRKAAAVELGRYLGLWKDRTEASFNFGESLAEKLNAAQRRMSVLPAPGETEAVSQ